MIYVGSLKYSPVYKSHCCAFGKECESSGYTVKYLFSNDYKWMLPPPITEKTIFIGNSNSIPSMIKDTLNPKNIQLINKSFVTDKPTHVYMHNYHFLNHVIANMCKKYASKFIYHAHEPHVNNKSAHGGFQHYWLYLSEYMGVKLLKRTDIAVVSSDEGMRLFDNAFQWFKGKKLKIPLLYEDLGNNCSELPQRKYITYVGPPVPAKGPEIFLEIVDYAAKEHSDWAFLMISREKITSPEFLKKKNLIIKDSPKISDEEYGTLMQRSRVVLTPYKRETQSSTILVSYMHGTPIISSNVGGLPEFVQNGVTGYLLDINASPEEWVKRINLVNKNFNYLSLNCRNYFVDTFSGKNWKVYIDNLLKPSAQNV